MLHGPVEDYVIGNQVLPTVAMAVECCVVLSDHVAGLRRHGCTDHVRRLAPSVPPAGGHQGGVMRSTQEFDQIGALAASILFESFSVRGGLWLSGSACREWPIATAAANRLPIDQSVSDRDCPPRIRQDPSRRPGI